MNKQIEEMEKLCQFFKDGNCTICEELLVDCNSNCPILEFAKRILEADYRRASDVVREIFSEIDDARDECTFVDELNIGHFKTSKFLLCLEYIKKKYEVTDDENRISD